MADRSIRLFRVLEVVVCGFFAVMGLAALAAPRNGLVGCAVLLGIAAFALMCFELRFWGHRRNIARVQRGLAEVGRRDLEGAAPVQERGVDDFVEELAANRAVAGIMARRSQRFCVSGMWRGRALEIGTAIVAGRDFDQMVSYVCVRDGAVRGAFRVMTRGALTSFSRMGMDRHPVATGDAAFDAKWVVDADDTLARTVLDPSMRARLVALQGELAWLQVASIEATRFGVVVRWPGELSPDGAAYLRDLAVEVHGRLAAPS